MRLRRWFNACYAIVNPRYQIINPPSVFNSCYKLYLYNNWHSGDVLFCRPLYKKLLESKLFDLVIGVYGNAAYLLEDLVKQGATLHISPISDRGKGRTGDLKYMCPPGYIPIHTWLGQFEDTHPHTWKSTVMMFNRKMQEVGINFYLSYENDQVPMIDFPEKNVSVFDNAIYVENGETRSEHSHFQFDLQRMTELFPAFHFYCTAKPYSVSPQIHDCSKENLVTLSAVSNHCRAVLGKGSGPFLCTYTEKNRYKPRAVCGYDTTRCAPFWDYKNNPLEYLKNTDDVIEFLKKLY